jgi:hypothetical protein
VKSNFFSVLCKLREPFNRDRLRELVEERGCHSSVVSGLIPPAHFCDCSSVDAYSMHVRTIFAEGFFWSEIRYRFLTVIIPRFENFN